MENLRSLLHQIIVIKKRYEEIFKISGENFNVFNILNLTSDELSHSRFIAELLNPKGSHGKGNIFLKSFLEKIKIDYSSLDNTIVEVEKNIGNIDENCDSGGRIDIAVTNDKKQILLIENKIYAEDQYRQLWRYHNSNKEAKIVYLTLDGREASEGSLCGLQKDAYIKISYEKEILEWLENCQKESINDSILRETLRQYIILIRQLTGQSRSREMEKEMVDVILESGNAAAAFDIEKNLFAIKTKIIENTIAKLKKLADSKRLEFNADFSVHKFSKFSFYRDDWRFLKLRFEFQEKNLKGLLYGFPYNSENNNCKDKSDEFPKDLIDFLKTKGYNKSNGYKENDWWPLYKFADSYKDGDVFVELAEKEKCDEFVKYVGNAIDELLKIIDEFNTTQKNSIGF